MARARDGAGLTKEAAEDFRSLGGTNRPIDRPQLRLIGQKAL